MNCQRNLEDFARLWVTGLPVLPANQGYTVTLSMTPSSGSPSINLYAANDPAGGTGYLTDPVAAVNQFTRQYLNGQLIIDYASQLATIKSGQSYTLAVNTDGTLQRSHFLFEGAGIGQCELVLTISQGSQVLARSSAWID